MSFLTTLDPAVFLYIMKSISEGLAAEGMTNLTTSDATGEFDRHHLFARYFMCFYLLFLFF